MNLYIGGVLDKPGLIALNDDGYDGIVIMGNDIVQSGTVPQPAASRWYYVGWLLTSMTVCCLYWCFVHPELRFWCGMVTHGNVYRRAFALTFDDGPHPLWAPLLADTLEQYGAKGTFCLVGQQAALYPEITVRLARAGHEVVNHSLTHPYPNLTAFSTKRMGEEVSVSAKVLRQLTHQPVHYFRPPGGGINNTLYDIVKRDDMQIAWWSGNAADAASPSPDGIIYRLHRSLRPGAIVLLHERGNTVAALAHFFANNHGYYRYGTFSNIVYEASSANSALK